MFTLKEGKVKKNIFIKVEEEVVLNISRTSNFLKGMYLKVRDSKGILLIPNEVNEIEISSIYRMDKD